MEGTLHNISSSLFSLIGTSIFAGLAVFLIIVATCSSNRQTRLKKQRDDVWLWSHAMEKFYNAIFGYTSPIKVSKAFGLEYDTYLINCEAIDYTPNLKKEAMMRVIGLFMFVTGIVLSAVFKSVAPMIVGISAYYFLVSNIVRNIAHKAKLKRAETLACLPRFADLLLSGLEIGLPVETALRLTAENMPCIISNEILLSIADMQMGAKSWQESLGDIAEKYEIDILSDFVLDIVTAYNKGISVADAVSRKSYELKQNHLLLSKEKTAKMSNTVLVPIMIFKIVPLLLILLLPVSMQILSVFG